MGLGYIAPVWKNFLLGTWLLMEKNTKTSITKIYELEILK